MRKRVLGCVMFLVVFLSPMLVSALDIDVDIGYGQCYSTSRFANTDWRIEGSFSVDSDIEFFICDAENYDMWVNNGTALLYEHQEQITSHTFDFTVPHDGGWYIVFSNAYSQGVISLEAELYYINKAGVTQTQTTVVNRSMSVTPVFGGFLIFVLGVCLFATWASRRSERQPAVKYEEILPKPG